jgi:hypothetical protein
MNTIELFSGMLQEGKEVFLSAEDLLTMFNRNNSKNAELLDYIGKKNLFEIIGKTRNEGFTVVSLPNCYLENSSMGNLVNQLYFTSWICFFTGQL